MSELFTYGSVRGATGNGGPYRDVASRLSTRTTEGGQPIVAGTPYPTARNLRDTFRTFHCIPRFAEIPLEA